MLTVRSSQLDTVRRFYNHPTTGGLLVLASSRRQINPRAVSGAARQRQTFHPRLIITASDGLERLHQPHGRVRCFRQGELFCSLKRMSPISLDSTVDAREPDT